jgi:hypothetical protein
MLVGASCATAPQPKPSTAQQMVVIAIDTETGKFTVQDTSGNALRSPAEGQSKVGTLTSSTAVTINVELQPASASTATTYSTTSSAITGTTCRTIIVNGVLYCR